MAKVTKKGKEPHGSELLENPEAIAEKLTRTEQFIEKNKKWVLIVGGAIALVIAGFFLYRYYVTSQNIAADNEMFQAVYYFEADSLDRALQGDGNNLGFLQIIDEYPLSDAANLAHYYAGVIYLKKGEYISAVDHLEDFGADDLLVQPRATALIGDARMEMEDYSGAAKAYEKAANQHINKYTTPMYLTKAAIAYEMMEDYAAALGSYEEIVKKYPNSSEFQNARKHKARVEGMMKE
jgi:TolA-binding protein